jgi:Fe-S cluster assembly iron-binding protein IscA
MTITESAQNKVDNTLNGEGFLGIHLEGGGCSGYQIKLSPSTDIPSDAQMLSDTIFSDPTSLEFLRGYICWSICVDITAASLLIWYIFK